MAPRRARPAPSLGLQVAAWCEFVLCHGPGDVRRQRIVHGPEALRFLDAAYRLHPRTGRRVFDRATLSRAKGWAKSELAGELVCAELLGPVRFSHWATRYEEPTWWGFEYEPGEPVGKPVLDPFIRCLATEETQTGNTYQNVLMMLDHAVENHGEHLPALDIGTTRTFVKGGFGGEVRPSTSGSASKDGGKETFGVADEIHLYVLPELRDMYETLERNLTKRGGAEPWMLSTTTMYQPGQDSIGERVHLLGEAGDPALLWDHTQADMPEDWDDDQQLLAALEQAAGDAWAWQDQAAKLRACRRTTKAKACRYFLNRPASSDDAAVSPAQWDLLKRTPSAERSIALGFDGSESDDSTFLVATEMTSRTQWVVGAWEKPEGWEAEVEWRVPHDEVMSVVEATFAGFNVAMMLCDPRGWRSEISAWQAAYTARGETKVLEFRTNSWIRMAGAVDRWLSAIREGQVGHDGDPRLRKHVLASHAKRINERKPDDGVVLVKGSRQKIDGAVASVLSLEAAEVALANGWTPPQPVSVLGQVDEDEVARLVREMREEEARALKDLHGG